MFINIFLYITIVIFITNIIMVMIIYKANKKSGNIIKMDDDIQMQYLKDYNNKRKKKASKSNKDKYTQIIEITKEDYELYSKLLTMTGNEIYAKYGLKRNETYTYTANFPDNIECDVKLVICEDENKPYVEAILFQNGCEIAVSDVGDNIIDTWELTNSETNITYTVITKVKEQ